MKKFFFFLAFALFLTTTFTTKVAAQTAPGAMCMDSTTTPPITNGVLDCDTNCITIDLLGNGVCNGNWTCVPAGMSAPDCDCNPLDVAVMAFGEFDGCTLTFPDQQMLMGCTKVGAVIAGPYTGSNCNDNNCLTTDAFDPSMCMCMYVLNPAPTCNDSICGTTDVFDSTTCTCLHIPIVPPSCNDSLCNTIDTYSTATCTCLHTQITSASCNDNNCLTTDTWDTTLCACTYTLVDLPICDDLNCGTADTFNVVTCQCVFTVIPTPSCNDNNCLTLDLYNTVICTCTNTPIPTPNCDDSDCSTADVYNLATCSCNYAPITSPSACDDANCGTVDTYDATLCKCINTPIPTPSCNDNNCTTTDTYNTATCACVYTLGPVPSCDDNDSTTVDSLVLATCQCLNTPKFSGSSLNFSLTDPCTCNNNASAAATNGTFSETISVNPTVPVPPGTMIRCNSLVGGDVVAPVMMSGSGPFTLTFNHVDMIGYVATNFEYSLNGGATWTLITNPTTGAPASISNKCAYPNPSITSIANYCNNSNAVVNLQVTVPSSEPILNTLGIQFNGVGVSAAAPWTYTPSTVAPTSSNTILLQYLGTNDNLGGISPDGGTTAAYPGCLQPVLVSTAVYAAPTATFATINAGCSGSNGTLYLLTAVNANYVYSINGAVTVPTPAGFFNGLPAGNHVLSIVDNTTAEACATLYPFTINTTTLWTVGSTSSTPNCGTNGNVVVSVDTSSVAITYPVNVNLWDATGTTILQSGTMATNAAAYTFASVPTGSYIIQVVDANGCNKLKTIITDCTTLAPCNDTINTCAAIFPGVISLCVPECYFETGDSITSITSAIHCSIEIKTNNCFTYQALPGMSVGFVDTLVVTFCTAEGVCFPVVYAVELGCVNPPLPIVEVAPIWVNTLGTSITQISTIGSLNNCLTIPVKAIDTDSAEVLTYSIIQPSNGSAWYNAYNTAIIYCPAYNACGYDTIQLIVTDKLLPVQSDILNVIIYTECPVVLPPVCNDTLIICMGPFPSSTIICPVFCNLGGLITLADSVEAFPTFECSIKYPGNGCFKYQPLPGVLNYNDTILVVGLDTLGNSDTAIVIVTIQDEPCLPPVVVGLPNATNDAATVNTGGSTTINVLANDTTTGPSLVNIVAGSGPMHGYVITNPDGSITYVNTDTTFIGNDCFDYTLCNATGCDTATVCVAVTNVIIIINPPIAVDNVYTTSCCAPVLFNVVANDTIPTGTILNSSILNEPDHGTAAIDSVTGIITYTADSGYSGIDVISYIICNQDNVCDTALVTIIINNNTAPVIIDTSTGAPIPELIVVTIPEDSTYTACNIGAEDANGDSISLEIINPSNGTWLQDTLTGCWTYTPNLNWTGIDTVVVIACDPSGACDTVTLIINVTPVDEAMIANNNAVVTSLNVDVTFNVLSNDSDPDGSADSTWIVAIVDSTMHGQLILNSNNTFTYNPDSLYCGIDTFFYSVCDTSGSCDTALVTISISCPNGPPVAVDNTVNTTIGNPVVISVLANDSDPNGDPIFVSSFGTPENGLVTFDTITQSFTYTPAPDFIGIDSFWYIICDSSALSACDTAWVIITVDGLEIYNGVTPNGDGKNDIFQILGIEGYANNKVMIFNRWGEKIFDINGYTNANGWSGEWQGNGKMLPDGTYYYMVYLNRDKITKNSTKSGFITLHRR